MRIAVAVKSHNPMAHMRMHLLESCMKSVYEAFPYDPSGGIVCENFLFMNGFDDGSQEAQEELAQSFDFHCLPIKSTDDNYTPGAGANVIGDLLSYRWRSEFPIFDAVVFSDDDMIWRPRAAEIVAHLILNKPDSVKIISGLLEPDWAWNKPRRTVSTPAGINMLVRDSCPGAGWFFSPSDWADHISPHIERKFGYDYDACVELKKAGFEVAQVDLAEHAGWGASTHGNEAINHGKPLDRKRWGV